MINSDGKPKERSLAERYGREVDIASIQTSARAILEESLALYLKVLGHSESAPTPTHHSPGICARCGREPALEQAIVDALNLPDPPAMPEPIFPENSYADGHSTNATDKRGLRGYSSDVAPQRGMFNAPVAAELTLRELEVFRLLAGGKSNREIAAELVISLRTAERHIANLYEKLGFHGKSARAAATAFAFSHGLIAQQSNGLNQALRRSKYVDNG
jgi:DNA-binding CsgD family transcriptional regulator